MVRIFALEGAVVQRVLDRVQESVYTSKSLKEVKVWESRRL